MSNRQKKAPDFQQQQTVMKVGQRSFTSLPVHVQSLPNTGRSMNQAPSVFYTNQAKAGNQKLADKIAVAKQPTKMAKVSQDTGGSGAIPRTIGLEELLAVSNSNCSPALNLSIQPTPIDPDLQNIIQHKLVVESSALAKAYQKAKDPKQKLNVYEGVYQKIMTNQQPQVNISLGIHLFANGSIESDQRKVHVQAKTVYQNNVPQQHRNYTSQSRSGSIRGRKLSPEFVINSHRQLPPANIKPNKEEFMRKTSFGTIATMPDERRPSVLKKSKSKQKLGQPKIARKEVEGFKQNLIGNMITLQTNASSQQINHQAVIGRGAQESKQSLLSQHGSQQFEKKPSKVSFTEVVQNQGLPFKRPPTSSREGQRLSKKKSGPERTLICSLDQETRQRNIDENQALCYQPVNPARSLRSNQAMNPMTLDLESQRNSWQKSNQLASGGTGELSVQPIKLQDQPTNQQAQRHPTSFQLTFSQHTHEKAAISNRPSKQLKSSRLASKDHKQKHSKLEKSRIDDLQKHDQLKAHVRSVADYQHPRKPDLSDRNGNSQSPHRQNQSQTSVDQLIRKNIKLKEKEKRLVLQQQLTKVQKRKMLKQEYEAKTEARVKKQKLTTQEQIQKMKAQLGALKVKHQTPIKEVNAGKRDASERVSDNQSNGNSQRNLPMRLSSAERRRAKGRMVSRSSSVERVIWEPETNNKDLNSVVPIRQLSGIEEKSANKREQRHVQLGLEYIQMKKELALALPLNSKQSAAILKGRAKKTEDADSFSPVQKKLAVQVQELEDDESERHRNPEKVKKLIEQSKKQWHDKEKEKIDKQIQEQRRILKNLMSLNEYQYRLHKQRNSIKEKQKDQPKQTGRKKHKKPKEDFLRKMLDDIQKQTGKAGKSKYEESLPLREVNQLSGAFEGQPVFNVQITRSKREQRPARNPSRSQSKSKSPRSIVLQPSAATGSASQFDQRKQPVGVQTAQSSFIDKKTVVTPRQKVANIKSQPRSAVKSQPRSSVKKSDDNLVTIRSQDNKYKSISSKSCSGHSPPSLSLPEGMSGASISNSHSKAVNKQSNRNNTPSGAAASRTDSLYSKRRFEYKNSISKQVIQDNKVSPQRSGAVKDRSPKDRKPTKPFDVLRASEGIENSSLNNEELVLYIILTQAAKMIQKAWRKFKQRKSKRSERDKIREELLKELEKRQPVSKLSGRSPKTLQEDRHTPRQLFAVPLSDFKEQQRKPTFSFGQEEGFQPKVQVSVVEQPEIVVLEAGESTGKSETAQKTGEKTASFKLQTAFASGEQDFYKELMQNNKQGNIPVDALLKQASQIRRSQSKEQFVIQMSDQSLQDEAKRRPNTVFEYIGSNPLRGAPQVFESQFSQNPKQRADQSFRNEPSGDQLVLSYGIDDINEDQIGSKKRGKFISRLVQDEDSFNASVAEKTDRIINYSAVLNTSEEMIEAAVNQSSTLRAQETHQGSSGINSSLLHKIMPKGSLNTSKRSPDEHERLDYGKHLQGIVIDLADKKQMQMIRAVSGGDETYANHQKQQISQTYSTNKTVQVQSQVSGGHQYLHSVISGSGILLPSLHSIDQSSQKQSQDAYMPIIQFQVPLAGIQNVSDSQELSSQRSPSPIKFEDRPNTSFQNVLYQHSSFEGLSHNSNAYQGVPSNSYFLHTNASIFERNPFREYTTARLQEMLQNKQDISELIQIKEEALTYARDLEQGWIKRQEKLAQISPRSLQKQRYELEQWVSAERIGHKKSDLSQKQQRAVTTFSTIEEERAQVAQIISLVNRKSAEIKNRLVKPTDLAAEEELEISIEDEDRPTEEQPANKEQLADAVAEQILLELLEREVLSPQMVRLCKRTSTKPEFRPEVMPAVEFQVNLDNSISADDQLIAGVDTSIEAVEQYIEGIFAQIRVRGKQFMSAFYTPIFRNPLTVLSNLQRLEIGQGTNHLDMSNTLASILNVQLYLTLEKARENVIREALQQIKAAANADNIAQDENLSELLSESDHIHNKAIFDAVNEALNLFRPYGPFGEPMPWSVKPRQNFFVYAPETQLEKVLTDVKAKLIEWSTTGAGQLSDIVVSSEQKDPKEQAAIKQGEVLDDSLQLQREECLAKLLAQDLIANECTWTDYEAEETQIKLDVADIILEQMISEIANELGHLDSRQV